MNRTRRPEPNLPEEVAVYWKLRRRTNRALVAIAAGVVLVVVFHNPRAWGDGDAALVLNRVGWIAMGLFAIAAFMSNAQMAEARGYCRGKFGRSPVELGAGAVPPKRARRPR